MIVTYRLAEARNKSIRVAKVLSLTETGQIFAQRDLKIDLADEEDVIGKEVILYNNREEFL